MPLKRKAMSITSIVTKWKWSRKILLMSPLGRVSFGSKPMTPIAIAMNLLNCEPPAIGLSARDVFESPKVPPLDQPNQGLTAIRQIKERIFREGENLPETDTIQAIIKRNIHNLFG